MKKLIFFFFFIFTTQTIFSADLSFLAQYADILQNCTPGMYNIPDPSQASAASPEVIVVKILGKNAGACQINVTKNMPLPGQKNSIPISLSCAFSDDNLLTLSNGAREASSSGSISKSSYGPIKAIIKNSCKRAP